MTHTEKLVEWLLEQSLTGELVDVKFGFAGDTSVPFEVRAQSAYEMLTGDK